jgi:hypothetical protein
VLSSRSFNATSAAQRAGLRRPAAAALVLIMGTGLACAGTPPELELIHAWSVEGPDNFQPSALALRDGVLLTVSDKHSDTIFRVDLGVDVARCVPAVHFTGPEPLPRNGWLDLEAIVPAPDGGFYLASEEGARLLHVPAGGGAAKWVTPDMRPMGAADGLMVKHNAYCEGLALLDGGRFLVAAEREPRGLLEISGEGDPVRVRSQLMETTHLPVPGGRNVDFADLFGWHGRMFALARNQHLVVELVRESDGAWREGEAWSFAATECAAAYRFEEETFGLTEGLAIDDHTITIVIDNGNTPRLGRKNDTRPWLFAFRNAIEAAD